MSQGTASKNQGHGGYVYDFYKEAPVGTKVWFNFNPLKSNNPFMIVDKARISNASGQPGTLFTCRPETDGKDVELTYTQMRSEIWRFEVPEAEDKVVQLEAEVNMLSYVVCESEKKISNMEAQLSERKWAQGVWTLQEEYQSSSVCRSYNYFMISEDLGFCKIGMTENLSNRLSTHRKKRGFQLIDLRGPYFNLQSSRNYETALKKSLFLEGLTANESYEEWDLKLNQFKSFECLDQLVKKHFPEAFLPENNFPSLSPFVRRLAIHTNCDFSDLIEINKAATAYHEFLLNMRAPMQPDGA
jgi:hypothetical protein